MRAIATLVCVLGISSTAFAHEFYATRVPNRATATNAVGTVRPCITCHNNPDGGRGCVDGGGMAPCLNPFGMAFRANGFQWNETLALMDADGDGFTNGQELQDPEGTWSVGQPSPGIEEYVTRPGFDDDSPGLHDEDGDGYCWFGRDMDGSGDCLDPAENDGSLDCDDMMPLVNSGATELCTNTIDDDCNGLDTLNDPVCADVVDRDGDGICGMGTDLNGDQDCIDAGEDTGLVDCDDDAITVFPGNLENCADGLDNDCNGDVDDMDSMCTGEVDFDEDGYCPIGRDLDGDGDCLDPGEPEAGLDCNDTNPLVNPGQAELCMDGLDNDCDGSADFTDTDCAGFFDADMDGHCTAGVDLNGNGSCIDEGEDIEPFDCNDMDPLVSPSAAEVCTNDQDDDCDTDVSLADDDCAGYLDRDGDRYCFVGFDLNDDGDCADPGEEGGSFVDCNDDDIAITPVTDGEPTVEICTDMVDNNCDGSTDAFDPDCSEYRDRDGDGWCLIGRDMNADGDCSDADEQAGEGEPVDFDDFDSSVFPNAPENCFDGKDNDRNGDTDLDDAYCTRDTDADGDGWCPVGRDLNGDGDCLDEGENIGRSDCDDADPERNPDTEEVCTSLRDDDCDGDVGLLDTDCFRLLDRDGDGFCGEGIDDNGDGDCLDSAEDRFGMDCDDTDPMINVRAREVCDDGIDNDCDAAIDYDDPQCMCEDEMCDDGDPCTIDACGEDNRCMSTPDPACTDGGMTGDAGMEGGGGGGCGCATPGSGPNPSTALLVLLGVAWTIRRRRR